MLKTPPWGFAHLRVISKQKKSCQECQEPLAAFKLVAV